MCAYGRIHPILYNYLQNFPSAWAIYRACPNFHIFRRYHNNIMTWKLILAGVLFGAFISFNSMYNITQFLQCLTNLLLCMYVCASSGSNYYVYFNPIWSSIKFNLHAYKHSIIRINLIGLGDDPEIRGGSLNMEINENRTRYRES